MTKVSTNERLSSVSNAFVANKKKKIEKYQTTVFDTDVHIINERIGAARYVQKLEITPRANHTSSFTTKVCIGKEMEK